MTEDSSVGPLPVYSWTGKPIAYRFNDGFRCGPCATADGRPPLEVDVSSQNTKCVDCGRELLTAEDFDAKKHQSGTDADVR